MPDPATRKMDVKKFSDNKKPNVDLAGDLPTEVAGTTAC